ncbi:Elongation of fatty acids protein 3 [Diplonema papillatum]|nr:Elongation of fatty acids protein 3 [Diplonema papillatum]
MDGIQNVIDVFTEKAHFVKDNMDWDGLVETIKHSEILYLSILFIVSKLTLTKLPESMRKAYLNPFLKVYNLGMTIFSFASFVAMAKAISEIDMYSNNCELAFEHPLFNLAAKAFYYSKFIEYVDSWSLILAGKPVSFLQSFHHLGAPWDMFLFYIAKNEGIWIFVLLNGFVHTVMYAYYFATLCKIRTPLKPLITIMQIAQFNVGFYLVWFYKDIPCYSNSPGRMFGWVYNYFYVGIVLVLFLNFSIWTYIFPHNKKAKSS